MNEADEIAESMLRRVGNSPKLASMDESRDWVKAQWPDWAEWVGYTMLDNIAESVWRLSRPRT